VQGDFLAGEAFEFGDELALAAQRCDAVVPVGTQVGEVRAGVGEQVPGDGEEGVADGDQGAVLATASGDSPVAGGQEGLGPGGGEGGFAEGAAEPGVASSSTTSWPRTCSAWAACTGSWRPRCSRRWRASTARRSTRWPVNTRPPWTPPPGHASACRSPSSATGEGSHWSPASAGSRLNGRRPTSLGERPGKRTNSNPGTAPQADSTILAVVDGIALTDGRLKQPSAEGNQPLAAR
jgi:hypothetical protein